MRQEVDIRYIVTSLEGSAQHLYEDVYCQRGQMVGYDRGADRASNDADVSSIPPIIPYGGFSPIRLEGWLSDGAFPASTRA